MTRAQKEGGKGLEKAVRSHWEAKRTVGMPCCSACAIRGDSSDVA